MKNFFTLLLALLITSSSYSQISELLYDIDWFLDSIEIDGVTYSAPSNSEVPFVTLDFSKTTPNFLTSICNDGFGDIISVEPFESFSFPDGLVVTLSECVDPDNVIFEDLYFNTIFLDNIDQPFEYFTVIIDNEIPTYGLFIMSADGNWAFYYDKVLSVPSNELGAVTIFPNPVTEKLNLQFLNEMAFPLHVSLIDTSGRLFFTETIEHPVSRHQINLKNVPAGLYFVQIVDDNGGRVVKKIIK